MLNEQLYNHYLASLLEGDKAVCSQVVRSLLQEKTEIKALYTDLFQRSMYQVGELWEYNKITVAVEHLATSITQHQMNLVYPHLFYKEKIGKKAVLACVADEYHQIGSRMVADIFELHGWDGYFLGSNTPIQDLLSFVEAQDPDVLGLSLAIYFNMQILHRTVDAVRRSFPDLPILIGGQAFRWGGYEIQSKYRGLVYIDSMTELEKRILKNDFSQ